MEPLRLDPSEPTQLDARFLVLWDRPDETPRGGVLALLRFCANRECDCGSVHVQLAEVDERLVQVGYGEDPNKIETAWKPGSDVPKIDLEPASIDTHGGGCEGVEPDGNSALVERFRQGLHAEVLDALHLEALEAKRLRPRWARDLPRSYEPGTLLGRDEVYAGARRHIVWVDDTELLASDLYCPTPQCDCHDVGVVFERLGGEGSVDDPLGIVIVSTSDPIRTPCTFKPAPGSDPTMLERAWAAYRDGFRDFDATVRARENELRKRLLPLMKQTFYESANGGLDEEPFVREEAKAGRNQPCPCGSGRKYKRCCGKAGASS